MPSSLAELTYSVEARDANGATVVSGVEGINWVPAAVKREDVSLTGSAFTALAPPTGSRLLILKLGTTVSLTLKSVTGDSPGVTISPASAPLGFDAMIPLGASPSIGIANGSASTQVVTCIWL